MRSATKAASRAFSLSFNSCDDLIFAIARICATSSLWSMGFAIKASAPTSNALMRLSLSPFKAVTKTTGILFVILIVFNFRHTSKPSMSGIMMSSSITSGFSEMANSIPCSPLVAVITFASGNASIINAFRVIRLSKVSSIASIFIISLSIFSFLFLLCRRLYTSGVLIN